MLQHNRDAMHNIALYESNTDTDIDTDCIRDPAFMWEPASIRSFIVFAFIPDVLNDHSSQLRS